MGYIADEILDRQWPFLFRQVATFHGQSIERLKVAVGEAVCFVVDEDAVVEVYADKSEKVMTHSGAK